MFRRNLLLPSSWSKSKSRVKRMLWIQGEVGITKPNCIIRGSVIKLITNGSKTPVMDVIGFLCVSLGTSHLHLVPRSRK
jgi:hypothetical protein